MHSEGSIKTVLETISVGSVVSRVVIDFAHVIFMQAKRSVTYFHCERSKLLEVVIL